MHEIDSVYLKDHKFRFAEDYKNLNPNGGDESSYDCLIQSIMYSTNQTTTEDWLDIYDALYDIGRRKFKAFNHTDVYREYLEGLGYEVVIFPEEDKNYKDHIIKTADFMDKHPKGNYLIGIADHVFPYIDGIIYEHKKEVTSNTKMPYIFYIFEIGSRYKYIYWYAKLFDIEEVVWHKLSEDKSILATITSREWDETKKCFCYDIEYEDENHTTKQIRLCGYEIKSIDSTCVL